MSESEPHLEAARWLRYAAEDLAAAEASARGTAFAPRHACWLAQQAAEKALKAVLVYVQVDFPWVHDLDALRNLIPEGWTVRHGHADLAALSEWAVEARYPSRHAQDPTPDDARGAVEEAREVYESARNDLGIRGVPVPSGPGLPEPGV